MKKIKKKLRSFISLFLAVCMTVSMLPSGVLASETGGTEVPSDPVIDSFDPYDCYGSDPYLSIDDYTSESQLPETLKVHLSNGENAEIKIAWKTVAETEAYIDFESQLPEDYNVSETLRNDIANGKARLPWIRASLPISAENSGAGQQVIISFGMTGASVNLPKGTLEEALASLPSTVQVTLEDGQTVDIPASWECTDDYEYTEYDLYTFDFVLPEGYILGGDLTEWDLPYYEVNISDMYSKEVRHSWTSNPDGTVTIDLALGATQDIVAYLEANANLYLGTPYNGDFDDPSKSGVPGVGMNCTGFVGHVLMACGADLSPIVQTSMPSYLAKAWTNLSCWEWWIDNNPDIISYRFNSTADALASGILEKGDIIIYEPDVSVWNAGQDAYGNKADCHIGFFWGDDSHDNKFWHSSHDTVGIEGSDRIVYAGTNPGNQISQLAPKCVSYCYVVKTTHPQTGYLQLQKKSSNSAMTDGNSCYSLEGAEYGVYTDAQCTAQNRVATLTTDADGKSETIELDAGIYYVKETKASKGFAIDGTTYTVEVTNGHTAKVPAVVQSVETPLNDPLAITLAKIDAESGSSISQGAASLAGAQFTICYYDGYYTKDTLPSTPKKTWVIETKKLTMGEQTRYYAQLSESYKVAGDDFYYVNGIVTLPLGTITIQETKAPEGYILDGAYLQPSTGGDRVTGMYVAQIKDYGSTARLDGGNEYIVADYAGRGGVKIQKRDAETSDTTAQGNASLAGAGFSIINQSANPVYVSGKLYGKGETVAVITTNEAGLAQTAADLLPYGTYQITETNPPTGYTGDGTITREFTITQDGVTVDLTDTDHSIFNEVIRGGVKVQKRDLQSNDGTAQGGGTLEGAVFEITNMSSGAVIVNDKSYGPGEVVARISTDVNGLAQTEADLLPFGVYKITEVTPPKGYLGEGILERSFMISRDGVMTDLTGEDQSIKNQVIRGDFELTKIDSDTQNAMAGIPFRITSNTTGESHTFTTDANGFYSSASNWNLHSHNTNGGGAEDGLWFGLDGEGNPVEVNDDLGALPFDTYTIEELQCDANADKVLYTGTLTISRDGYTIDMGNIENETVNTPAIYTSARNEDTGTAYAIAQAGTVIIDTVTYTGLTPGETYTLQGTLMNAATGEPVMNGERPVTGEKTFKAILENGTVEVEFVFDASGLAGADVVVFEKLIYEDREVAAHEDLEDEGQTIHFPGIGTTAKDSSTGVNVGAPMDTVTIIDTVVYTNLQAGRSYTLTGTLMDKESGKPVLIDGREVTVTKTFIPETSDGAVDMEFTLDASGLAGKSVVVFESLSRGIVVYAVHEDIEDEGQTVHFPEIGTTAVDGDTGNHMGDASKEDVIIVDTVSYTNLAVGKEYTVTGTLMDKATGEPLTYNGQTFTVEKTFTEDKADGSVDLTFTVPGAALLGKVVVAFERVAYEGIEVGFHTDINDENQTVYYPEIGTTAADQATGTHYAFAEGKVTVQDIVEYAALIPGKTYVMTGTLMNASDGEPVMNGEEPVTSIQEFIPEASDGSLEMTFTFDASALAGSDVVVFESLTLDGTVIAAHEDMEDEGQTIHFPKISTTAVDGDTNDHMSNADGEVTLIDTVTYKNLEPGTEYILTGTLMDKATGEVLVTGEQTIASQITFTPEKANGSVEVTFTFDGSGLAGKDLVVFEELSMDSHLMASHKDIEDEGQTIHFPEIQTTAADDVTGDHVGNGDVEEVTITDAVAYKNLISGREYTVTGTLMDKATGEPLTYDGQTFTAEITFTPEKADGSIDLTFTVPGAALLGKTVVAFERVTYEGIEVGSHTDINDEEQTVYYPEIGTTAKDSVSGTHQGFAREDTVIVDEVVYKGVEPGQEYTMKGILMDKATGEPYLVDGKAVTVQKTFTAETEEGAITLEFAFDGSGLKDVTLVVFENLYYGDKEVGSHKDLTDEGQTVSYPEITLKTEAKDKASGTHEGKASESVAIVDTVTYTGLIPGKEYTMKGILMDQATGKAFLVDGKKVTAQTTFTPEEPDGSVEMVFTFDGSALDKKTLVVFESLYYGELEIGTHADLNDAAQTVKIVQPEVPGFSVPRTGIGEKGRALAVAFGMLIAAAGVVILIAFQKRKVKE